MKRPSLPILLCAGLALLTCSLLLAGCGGVVGGVTTVSTPNRGVFPPNATPYGKTYGEWGDEWWKWVFAIPKRDNPLLDETGEKAGVGQSGPVWLVAGTIGATAERTFTVPADKAIFFPIVNFGAWIPADATTVEGLRAVAKYWMDHVPELEVTVDGVALQGLQNYRFQSPASFTLVGPADEADTFMMAQTGTHEGFADGYWIMLEPLSPGPHTVYFRGKIVLPATFPDVQEFEAEVTCHITVQ
jgi:hypothetical protein